MNLVFEDGTKRVLTCVGYVPQLKRNFISLRMLDESGCSYIESRIWSISTHVRHSPQQNGLGERMNSTILERMRYIYIIIFRHAN